jgi:hypothetical protein
MEQDLQTQPPRRTPGSAARAQAFVEKSRAELEALAREGLVMAGNAFSSVLFLKCERPAAAPTPAGAPAPAALPLSGEDGRALRASLTALGYAPEDWVALSTLSDAGAPLEPMQLRRAVCALDPQTVVACDAPSAQLLREAYAQELPDLQDLCQAMLDEGEVAQVLGMRLMNLGDFAAALSDSRQKQVMWARLKKLRPLGEPY